MNSIVPIIKNHCHMNPNEYIKWPGAVLRGTSTKDAHLFIDNGAKVLAVAHLDYIGDLNWGEGVINGHRTVFSRALDDRLGVAILLEILPLLDPTIAGKYDILLTDGEESGQSTAEYFKSEKKYNWIFEFDRAGADYVDYDYNCGAFDKALKKAGVKKGTGSFSDICSLEHLKAYAFNFGCGYRLQHNEWCNARTTVILKQCRKFISIFHKMKGQSFPSGVIERTLGYGSYYDGRDWDREEEQTYYRQWQSGRDLVQRFCPDCFSRLTRTVEATVRDPATWFCPVCQKVKISPLFPYEVREERARRGLAQQNCKECMYYGCCSIQNEAGCSMFTDRKESPSQTKTATTDNSGGGKSGDISTESPQDGNELPSKDE
jgi:hypothetical protein